MLREYFNGKADIWDEEVAEKDTSKLVRMAGRLDLEPGAVILDVGTGTGVFLPYLLESIGTNGKVVAIDIAEEMLARAKAKELGRNIEYLQADIDDTPLDGEMFDSIVCYSSVPHIQDKLKALAEMKRVMKGGGRLLICHTSSRAHINEIHSQIPEVAGDTVPDGDEMRSILSAAGFDRIKIEEDTESYLASAERPRDERQLLFPVVLPHPGLLPG